MIIIAENKKNHYLIKKFLIESDSFDDNLRQDQGGLHRRFIHQDDIIEKDDTLVNKLIKKRPQFLGIKNFLKIPLIAITLLWSNNLDDASLEISRQNNIPVEQVKETILSDDNINYSFEYNTDVEFEDLVKKIMAHEGFEGLPYPDVEQWSIGYGTRVSDDLTFSVEKGDKLRKSYDKVKSKGSKAIIKWISSIKELRGWKRKFFKKYNIKSKATKDNSAITESEGEIASRKSVKAAKTAMERIEYFEKLPQNVKIAFFDMAYNMGSGFLKKFKNFNKAISYAVTVLSSDNLNSEEIDVANNMFSLAADEILYNFEEDGTTLRGMTKYHQDLRKSGRPQRNAELVRRGIENPDLYMQPENFQNESLKKVYSHLFV